MKLFAGKSFNFSVYEIEYWPDDPGFKTVRYVPLPRDGEARESYGFMRLPGCDDFEVRPRVWSARFIHDQRQNNKDHDEIFLEINELAQARIDGFGQVDRSSWDEHEQLSTASEYNRMVVTTVIQVVCNMLDGLAWIATSSDAELGAVIEALGKAGIRVKNASPWCSQDLPSPITFLGKLDPGQSVLGALAVHEMVQDQVVSLVDSGGKLVIQKAGPGGVSKKSITRAVLAEFDTEMGGGCAEIQSATLLYQTAQFHLNAFTWRFSKFYPGSVPDTNDQVEEALENLSAARKVFFDLDREFSRLHLDGRLNKYASVEDRIEAMRVHVLQIKAEFGERPEPARIVEFLDELNKHEINPADYQTVLELIRHEEQTARNKVAAEQMEMELAQ